MPKNLSMCINFSKPGVLSKPFPILSRWNEGSSEKKTGTSCLLTESQLFYLLLSTSPAVNIFAGSKTETHGRDKEKNEREPSDVPTICTQNTSNFLVILHELCSLSKTQRKPAMTNEGDGKNTFLPPGDGKNTFLPP